ncbi:MAG: hypothetical protein ACLQQ4_03310 [Bacteroidia bacterium]
MYIKSPALYTDFIKIKAGECEGWRGSERFLIKKNNIFALYINDMKGITFIKDETHNKRLVQIDLDTIEKYEEKMEDLFDIIIAEARKDEESISWEEVKKQLKKKGKL